MKNFLQDCLRGVSLLHDARFHEADLPGPGLITPVSRLGRRIYYEIMEFDEPLDSVNIVSSCRIAFTRVNDVGSNSPRSC